MRFDDGCWCRSFAWHVAALAVVSPTVVLRMTDGKTHRGALTALRILGEETKGLRVHRYRRGHAHVLSEVILDGGKRFHTADLDRFLAEASDAPGFVPFPGPDLV